MTRTKICLNKSFLFQNFFLSIITLIFFPLFLSNCAQMEDITKTATSIASATGVISSSQKDSIDKSAVAVAKTFQDITPEQEYYIGRTIGAIVVNKYEPYDNPNANAYVNTLGQLLSKASDMPETFGGYHFLILDSNEINAFAAPGGLIFISRGLIKCCETEDALAAVLAHEIGHVQYKHGLKAIKASRITEALSIIGTEAAKTFSGQELSNLTDAFEDSISDIVGSMVNNGYSRSLEEDADKAAITILQRVGYNPSALISVLNNMKKYLKPGGHDFAKTHPSPNDRISKVRSQIGSVQPVSINKARQDRFSRALKNI